MAEPSGSAYLSPEQPMEDAMYDQDTHLTVQSANAAAAKAVNDARNALNIAILDAVGYGLRVEARIAPQPDRGMYVPLVDAQVLAPL